MKCKISIDHKAAVLAGKNVFGPVEIEVDPASLSPEQRAELVLSSQNREGIFDLNHPVGVYAPHQLTPIAEVLPETVATILEERICLRHQNRETERQKDVQDLTDFAQKSNEELITIRLRGHDWDFEPNCFEISGKNAIIEAATRQEDQGTLDRIQHLAALGEQQFTVAHEKWAAEQAAKKQAKADAAAKLEAAEKRKRLQIADWVQAKGSENQKARLAEDMLPEAEILDCIREELYAPLSDWPKYRKIKSSDVCTCDDEPCRVEFEVVSKTEVGPEEYATLCQLRQLLPDAPGHHVTITIREHTGVSSDCDETESKVGYKIYITVGELEFSREYEAK